MAGDAAGQITASLTLDIKGFTDGIKKAQDALDKLTGRRGGGGGGGRRGPLGGGKQADENKKLAASLRLISSSYNSLNRAVAAGVVDAKKASQQYSVLNKKLQVLEPQVRSDQKAINALNSAMAASAGAETFRKNQEDARMAAEKMAASIGGSTSKVGSFFKVMGTGIASGSRGMVMSITNITEAFQKGQMGGRMLSTFLLGDLMDAFMIGTFVTDGFNKAAASLGPTMAAQANMLRSIGKLFPVVTLVTSAAAAAFGYFAFNQDKTKKSSEKMKKEARELSGEISDLEFFLRNAGSAQRVLNEAFQDFNADDAKDEIAAVKKQISQLPKLGRAVSRLKKEIDDQNSSLSQAGKEIKNANRDFAKYLKIEEDLAKKTSDLNKERDTELGILESLRKAREDIYDPTVIRSEALKKSMTEAVNKEIDLQKMKILNVENAISRTGAAARLLKGYIEGQRDALKDIVDLAPKVKEAVPKTPKKRKSEEEKEEKGFAGLLASEMQVAIDMANAYQKKIDEIHELQRKAGGAAEADAIAQAAGLQDVEKGLGRAQKRQQQLVNKAGELGPEIQDQIEGMRQLNDEQRKASMEAAGHAASLAEVKKAMDLAAAAAELGIDVEFTAIIDPGAQKVLQEQMKRRGETINFLDPLMGGTENVLKAFKGLTKASNFIADLIPRGGEDFRRALGVTAEGLVLLGAAAMTAASAMTAAFGQAAMGNFGSFMSGALGAVGAGAGVAAGIDPATGQAIGQALGGFADMVIGKMEVTSDVVDPDTGEKIVAPMMALFEQEFNDALKPALKAFEPFGKLVFYVATRLGLLLGKLSEALTPLIDLVGTLLMSVFQIFYIQIMAMVPLMAAYVSVLQLLIPVIEFLNQGIVLLGNAMAQFAIWVGWLINEFAKLIEDIPLIGEGLHAALNGMGDALISGATEFATSLVSSLDDLNPEIQAAANQYAQQNENMREANKEASKVLNAPKGFKVEKYRYEAMDASQTNPFTGSSLDGGTVINIENIFVEDGEDLLDQLNDANQTGGVGPTGGF